MNDQRKYEQMMGSHIDRQLQREWEQKYSQQAVNHFSRPANICEMCGQYMTINPENGRQHKMDNWERKWSVHRYCAKMVEDRLDREGNVNSRRQ
jgi:hypothetical protein